MNKILSLVVILCALCASSASARIGETEAQIEKRYGKFLPPAMPKHGIPMKMYRAAGMIIGVAYLDGKSEAEFYQKQETGDFSDHEIQLLLDTNSAGKKWDKVQSPDFNHENWTREGAIASRDKFATKPALMIMTLRFTEISKANREAEEKETLKGF
jgi:hypothetical protein